MDLVRSIAPLTSVLAPVIYFGISSATSLVAINVAPPYRIYFAPSIILFALLSFRHLNDIPSWLGLDSLWGLFIIIYIMHITAVLYIEKVILLPRYSGDEERIVLGTQQTGHCSTPWNIKAAYKIWSNPRWLPPIRIRESHGTEILDSIKYQHAQYSFGRPSMTAFVLIRVAKLCIYALFYYFIHTYIFPGYFQPMTINDFTPHRERYFSRLLFGPSASAAASGAGGVTIRETLLRIVLAVDWVVAAYLLLEGCHHMFALLFVAVLRIDDPQSWPPFFGSAWRITSIQRFWGGFWHRLVVEPYGSYALLLSQRVMALKAGSKVEKVLVVFCIFLFSGIAHSVVSWQMGQRCGLWRDVAWFAANFAAGLAEGAVQRQSAALAETIGIDYHRFASGWGGKMVGFSWVFVFFFWSVPKWQFPKIYCATLLEIYNY